MTTKLMAAFLGSFLSLSGVALAADAPAPAPQAADKPRAEAPRQGRFEKMLEHMDTNKDGSVSKAEYLAVAEARFAKMDKNQDGKIDAADKPAPRQERAGRGAPPPPPEDDDAPPPPPKDE